MPPELAGWPLVLIALLAGLAIGSFLNVCIYRVPRDLSVVRPRSFCPGCGHEIAAYDNIPVLSFLMLRASCRNCGEAISFRYPAVELITALLFACVVYRFGAALTAVKWLIFEALLVILFWTDWETEILPDEFTLGGSLVAVVVAWFVPVPGMVGDVLLWDWPQEWRSLANVIAGACVLALPVWLLGWVCGKLLRKDVLGLGDVKLLLMLGCFLGLEVGLQCFAAAAITGAVAGGAWMVFTRKQALSQTLRFGCFLCFTAAFGPLLKASFAALY